VEAEITSVKNYLSAIEVGEKDIMEKKTRTQREVELYFAGKRQAMPWRA